ncbi:MAG TPA: AsmA family protein [Candidatus Nitrosotenuis sp.]|nr:AsmA family protein [Candidatus Nitrosotenuis sp.]
MLRKGKFLRVNSADSTRKRWSWRRWAALLLICLVAFYLGSNHLLSLWRVRQFLEGRLQAAFGRNVEVGGFELALFPTPELVANYVTVEEDPRFGAEYFVRAEKLTASLRWTALLRGRIELDAVSFTRPSLNLVRLPDGRWNLESWLPPLLPAGLAQDRAAPSRLTSVKISEGRVNFKRGVDKHPFAFIYLEGTLTHEDSGQWRVDLEASPFRAGVTLQEAGTIRLRGRLGSTSARLRPAELELNWTQASLADCFRLLLGRDAGIRGSAELQLLIRSGVPPVPPSGGDEQGSVSALPVKESDWQVRLTARALGVHRWNLPEREKDPNLNLHAEAIWDAAAARVDVQRILLEAPRSNLRGSGFFQWSSPQGSQFRLLSSGIAWDDVLAWHRAFREGVTPQLSVEGTTGVDTTLSGWPPHVQRLAVASDGARIHVPGLAGPLFVSRIILTSRDEKIVLAPVNIVFPRDPAGRIPEPDAGRGQFSISGTATITSKPEFAFRVAGETTSAEDLAGTCAHFGFRLVQGWPMEGPVRLQVTGAGTAFPFQMRTSGTAQLANLRLRPAVLNHPLLLRSARFDWQQGEPVHSFRRITISSAEAFATRWSGQLESSPGEPWRFSLAADRLEAASLHSWLSPQRERTFLQRALDRLPFVRPQRTASEADEFIDSLQAQGKLHVGKFFLDRIEMDNLRGAVHLSGRNLRLFDAEAGLYRGRVRGAIGAQFAAEPNFEITAAMDATDLGLLSNVYPSLKEKFGGALRGKVNLRFGGATRTEMLAALSGEGEIEISQPQFRGFNLRESLQSESLKAGVSAFRRAHGRFALQDGKIVIELLSIQDSQGNVELRGQITPPGTMDLRGEIFSASAPGKSRAGTHKSSHFRVGGTLAAPVVEAVAPPRQ